MKRRATAFVPFAYGFRPFFLVAGWYALAAIAVWGVLYRNGGAPFGQLPPYLWHGHEMLFGFVAAAVAGFMLTAVPSWTGNRGFSGRPLILLFLLWLAGRAAMASAGWLPFSILALLELAFLPALALTIAPSLLRSSNRNRPLLAVLTALWTADAVFVYGLGSGNAWLAARALGSALDVVLLLITVIGGRIVPAFTASALRQAGIEHPVRVRTVLERFVIAAMAMLVIAGALLPSHWLTASLALAAAGAHAWRMAGWQGPRTLSQPIVWVLHLAYAWLPVGLALRGIYLLTGASWAAHWLHALGAGAAATMILAVMTRAALGHTGRALTVGPPVALAYALLGLATILRVFGPAALPFAYTTIIVATAVLWCMAFALYVWRYTPILVRPRADGKPG